MNPSIEDTYRRYFPALREKCRRMLADSEDAQDVAQETFIRFWKANLKDLHPIQVTSWLYRTSTRLAIDRARRKKPERRAVADVGGLAACEVPGPEMPYFSRQLLSRLAGVVPARELEVAILQRLDGLSQQELGEVLGISDRTARRILKRLDQRLLTMKEEVSL